MAKTAIKGMARLQATLNGKILGVQKNWMARLLERVLRRGAQMHLNAGFLEGATYPDGTPVAAVAYWNEMGGVDRHGKKRDARPFMRNTIAKNQDQWSALLAKNLENAKGDLDKAIELTAIKIAAQMQGEIRSFAEKGGNKPSTVEKKGFDSPLIDTGHMLNSVGYEVVSD
ncbi:hypothetical protein NKW43_14105 [Gluconobacter albidus]|uniref:hypothetical protein n=1 Tax=Gluconobacter albidus TaxID=318683 RepID=UPI00209FF62C|nr:hypothetical protein [Gluconobacter albidus]MCP1274801.1 hypothetical protein [Gluconobacter albidus]